MIASRNKSIPDLIARCTDHSGTTARLLLLPEWGLAELLAKIRPF